MKFPALSHPLTGVLVPVSALRSAHSVGTGEFADLPLLADFCAATGMSVIQVLPVNDTGAESSPYSALSAFALHPLYIRLQDLPEISGLESAVADLRTRTEGSPRLDYPGVRAAKLDILRDAFAPRREQIASLPELQSWIADNPWIKPYAVFCRQKQRNQDRSWKQWESLRDIDLPTIEREWKKGLKDGSTLFYAWVQFRLEEQLRAAARELDTRGIALKGDLPILMNEDSADAWAHRDIFDPAVRAGAPPDMFSELGQNWDFPVYNWQRLGEQDYDWWKRRLVQADKFYHAFRIDHVLGFFRIWAVPAVHFSGILGHFAPAHHLSVARLNDAGFDDGRIRWLAEPHIPGDWIRGAFGPAADAITAGFFRRIGNEDLFLFAPEVTGERAIASSDRSEEEKETLLGWYRDRALLQLDDDTYAVAWRNRECTRFASLSETERAAFTTLAKSATVASESIWAEQGRRLLAFMNETTGMLACAEDLGVIPDCVPETLEALGILGLRVPRWGRPGIPDNQPVTEYPALTVCAPSVHDTSTLRQWWEDELTPEKRAEVLTSLAIPEKLGPTYSEETAWRMIAAMLKTTSRICMFQIQDLFATDPRFRLPVAADERVNTPGTWNRINWTYRVPHPLEELVARTDTVSRLNALVAKRSKRSPA